MVRLRIHRSHAVLLATLAAGLCMWPSARAEQASAQGSLKGKYSGPFTSDSGGDSGTLKLTITKDKDSGGSRALKGVAKFGRTTFKVQGAYEPSTRQMNLTGVKGRPPRITQASIVGYFTEDEKHFDGSFQIYNQSGANTGTAVLDRKGK
jgi:hypothetical protein